MTKDDPLSNSPTDHIQDEYLQATENSEESKSDVNEEDSHNTPPNLDDIRSAGL